MQYNKYTIKTVTEAEDIISASLAELGIEGIEIEDKIPLTEEELQGMFVDIMPQGAPDDGIAYVSFYLDASKDNTEMLKAVEEELKSLSEFMDIGEAVITSSTTKDEDFLNSWKQYFHQFYIDDILFIPSWETIEEPLLSESKSNDEDQIVIHIDPGTAFGTGSHETTRLCIRALRRYIREGMSVLDVGTGSGILALMAYKFGASYCIGTDLDPCAVPAVADNMEKNGLKDKNYELIIGNIIDDKEVQDKVGYDKYDIVCANILAEVLIPLIPVVKKTLKPGGTIILSGIIEGKEEIVAKTLEDNGYEVVEINEDGEWRSVVAIV
ncbi:MAG: 50S ribosomal protein L11 methyltransferase [Lachnospiraceae bacterium]|nr:50S ribosomal protein L11 methyltransferase [Lachnospiraceae bacterium]